MKQVILPINLSHRRPYKREFFIAMPALTQTCVVHRYYIFLIVSLIECDGLSIYS